MANTSVINSELYSNLVTAAQFAAYENSVARQMVTIFDAPANSGKVLQVPVWSSIAAENITDESAATAKDTNTTSQTITLTEHVVYHQITDMLRDSAQSNVINQLGDQSSIFGSCAKTSVSVLIAILVSPCWYSGDRDPHYDLIVN